MTGILQRLGSEGGMVFWPHLVGGSADRYLCPGAHQWPFSGDGEGWYAEECGDEDDWNASYMDCNIHLSGD
jgi:hypothetical protein